MKLCTISNRQALDGANDGLADSTNGSVRTRD